jgi:hypothetical protein
MNIISVVSVRVIQNLLQFLIGFSQMSRKCRMVLQQCFSAAGPWHQIYRALVL